MESKKKKTSEQPSYKEGMFNPRLIEYGSDFAAHPIWNFFLRGKNCEALDCVVDLDWHSKRNRFDI